MGHAAHAVASAAQEIQFEVSVEFGLSVSVLTLSAGRSYNEAPARFHAVAARYKLGRWRSLGARLHGMQEVGGSNPLRSTKDCEAGSFPPSVLSHGNLV